MSSLSSILISTLKNFSFLSFNFTVKRGFCCPSSHWFYLQYQLFYWSWKCVYLQMLFSSSFLWILKYVILPQIYFSSPQYILFLFQRSHFFPCWKSHTFFFSSWLVSKLISDGFVSLGCEEDFLFTLLWNEFSQSQKVFPVIIHFQGRAMYLLLVLSQQKMSVAVLYVYSPKCSVMVTCPSLLALGWGMRIRPAHLLRPTATVIGTVCIRHANTNETPGPLRKQSPGKLTFCLKIFVFFQTKKTMNTSRDWIHFQGHLWI